MVLSAHALIVQLRVQVQVQVRVALIIILLCSSKLLLVCTSVQALPKGFVSEIVNPHTKAVTGVFAPNLRRNDHRPMMIVASKPGRVRVLENPENLNEDNDDSSSYTNKENADSNCDSNCDSNGDSDSDSDSNVILDLSGEGNMCDNGERGLTSIAIHPDFLETRWVYLYYTRWREGCLEDALLGPQNVLVRYTMNATTLLLENEELLLECGVLAGRVHNGGAMMFGTDGYLYLATGDGSSKSSVQDRTNLLGSLLRLNDDGSIPDTNPYAGKEKGVPCGKSNGVVVPPEINAIAIAIAIANGEENDDDDDDDVYFCSEIYSWGFRNPIRMALHHNKSNKKKVLFSISDVGAQQFEELSWAGTDFKEKNYGWPFLEGPCVPNSIDDCPLPSSFDDSNSNVVDPFHYYAHVSYENGGCVAGSAFVPEGTNWPEEYNYLFIDFILLKIYNLVEDPDAECRESCSPPTSRFINTTCKQHTHTHTHTKLYLLLVPHF
jgi:glucose/arabinose dehydrogenase